MGGGSQSIDSFKCPSRRLSSEVGRVARKNWVKPLQVKLAQINTQLETVNMFTSLLFK